MPRKQYSILLRAPYDLDEQVWRATHKDALIGAESYYIDECMAANPDLVRMGYATPRHIQNWYVDLLIAYLASIGKSDKLEDCYLHWKGATPRADRRAKDFVTGDTLYFANPASAEWNGFMQYHCTATDIDGVLLDVPLFLWSWEASIPPAGHKLSDTDEYDGVTINDAHPYGAQVLALLGGINTALKAAFGADVYALPNMSSSYFYQFPGSSFITDIVALFDGTWNETGLSNTGNIKRADLVSHISKMSTLVAATKNVFMGAFCTTFTSAGEMLAIAIYHMVCQEPYTWCGFRRWSTTHRYAMDCDAWQYIGALDADIGTPTGAPAWIADTVIRRNFTDGVALANVKPDSGLGSPVVVDLVTQHQGIYADGTLGPSATSFTLAIGEGKLLRTMDSTVTLTPIADGSPSGWGIYPATPVARYIKIDEGHSTPDTADYMYGNKDYVQVIGYSVPIAQNINAVSKVRVYFVYRGVLTQSTDMALQIDVYGNAVLKGTTTISSDTAGVITNGYVDIAVTGFGQTEANAVTVKFTSLVDAGEYPPPKRET